jgi:protein phosphatase
MNMTNRPSTLPWQGIGLTDVGLVRTSNQDAYALENTLGLWVIADGMGGHAGGSIASQLAIQSVVDHVQKSYGLFSSNPGKNVACIELLQQAVATGDAAIRHQVSNNPELEGMGTTVVIALLCPDPSTHLAIAHVGDSRAYLIRNGAIRSLTTDHSFVQRLLTEGQITAEEATNHPNQNLLLRALGAEKQSTPDVSLHSLEPQDIVLLSTDGLTKMVDENDILAIVSAKNHSPVEACRKLIERANSHGGKDNTTVVLISPSD